MAVSFFSLAKSPLAAGCPVHVYTCDYYCVRQYPVDETEIPKFRVCVNDEVQDVEAAVNGGEENCPSGYHLSGCECMIEEDEFGDQTECTVLGQTSDPPPADDRLPRPDPRFKK